MYQGGITLFFDKIPLLNRIGSFSAQLREIFQTVDNSIAKLVVDMIVLNICK